MAGDGGNDAHTVYKLFLISPAAVVTAVLENPRIFTKRPTLLPLGQCLIPRPTITIPREEKGDSRPLIVVGFTAAGNIYAGANVN